MPNTLAWRISHQVLDETSEGAEIDMGMFCFQCEQAAKGSGCTVLGVCGKDPNTAALQDLLVYAVEGVSVYAHQARRSGAADSEIDRFVCDALFTCVTNVNFDPQRMEKWLQQAGEIKKRAQKLVPENAAAAAQRQNNGAAGWEPAKTLDALILHGAQISISRRLNELGPDITGLQELLLYGLKGTAAYAVHARRLGEEKEEVYAFFHEALAYLAQSGQTADQLLDLSLRCGAVNLTVMEMLDRAHTAHFGHPIPTSVRISPVKGKAILVSGHDLGDLEALLKQTEGSGINVYTHGEMLPAHGYPALKKFKHLVGNYGGAWQDQQREFAEFPGAVLLTTNCIQKPLPSYQQRIFTSGLVAWPGVQHVEGSDFAPVIAAAQAEAGFNADLPEQTIVVGFGHHAVLGVADKVVDAVKKGLIKHFFLIGGCDGAKSGRNYYTEFARSVPRDAVILTLACGKYRFNKEDFGEIAGIPRLLDLGQCNDAYSAIKIAVALGQAFSCGVNDLPLSLILSWYEQKAVCILLTLLHLGIRNIRLGPTLPAFLTPGLVGVLAEKFNLMPITAPEADLAACLKTES